MFGYKLVSYNGYNFKIAEPEKAILDYFYLNKGVSTEDDFAGLRFNDEEFREQTDKDKLQRYLVAFTNKRLEKRFDRFLMHINHD